MKIAALTSSSTLSRRACAIEGKAEYFLTTDDKLLKKLAETKELVVINPVNFIPILENM